MSLAMVLLAAGVSACAGTPSFRTDAELARAIPGLVGPQVTQAEDWNAILGLDAAASPDGRWRFVVSARVPQFQFRRAVDQRVLVVPGQAGQHGAKLPLEQRGYAVYAKQHGWVLWTGQGREPGSDRTAVAAIDFAADGAIREVFATDRRLVGLGEMAFGALAMDLSRADCPRLCASSFAYQAARKRRQQPIPLVAVDIALQREPPVRLRAVAGPDARVTPLPGTRWLWTPDTTLYALRSAGPDLRAEPIQRAADDAAGVRCVAASPQGAFVRGCANKRCYCTETQHLWRKQGGRYRYLGEIAPGPSVAFDERNQRVATASKNSYSVWDVGGDAPRRVWGAAPLFGNDYPVRLRLGSGHLTVIGGARRRLEVRRFDLAAPARVDVRLDGTPLTLSNAPWDWDKRPWPRLKVTHRWETGRGDQPARLEVTVSNAGGAAHRVTARLTSEPAGIPGLPEVLHFGTIGPGQHVVRSVHFQRPAVMDRRVCRLTLRVTEQLGFDPPPRRWVTLPDWIADEAHYHRVAKAIVGKSLEHLRAVDGKPSEAPGVSSMGPTGFGFTYSAGFGGSVSYQNLFAMDAAAHRVNRQVSQTQSVEEMRRHAQMFLAWFLPHELVHAHDGNAGTWPRERRANLAQPHLTAAVLAALPELPYTAETMAWIYDDYESRLRDFVTPQERTRIDAYARNPAAGAPFARGALDMFLNDTTRYVYWIARCNQLSWRAGGSLADRLAEPLSRRGD